MSRFVIVVEGLIRPPPLQPHKAGLVFSRTSRLFRPFRAPLSAPRDYSTFVAAVDPSLRLHAALFVVVGSLARRSRAKMAFY